MHPNSIVNRLSADYHSAARTPDVQTICQLFDRAIADGGTGLGAAEVFEKAEELGISFVGCNLAINALRWSRALDFKISLPKELYPSAPAVYGERADELLPIAAQLRVHGNNLAELLLARYEVRLLGGVVRDGAHPPRYETRIESNGSAWAGETPKEVRDLVSVMGEHVLDPGMNRIEDNGFGWFRFSGNFLKHSHVFNISTNDPQVVVLLLAAMHVNRSRTDYVADCDTRDHAAGDYLALLQATGNRDAYLEARRENAATRPPRAGELVLSQAAIASRRPKP